MFVYAVVPVKSLGASKNRLSSVLSPQERSQLTLAMLEDVLNALQTSTVNNTVVVSNDLTVHDVVDKFGAMYLVQKTSGLNSAIEEATEWCVKEGAEAILVLPADIPLLSSADVDRIVELGNCKEQTVVLSPSYDWWYECSFPESAKPDSCVFWTKKLRGAHQRGTKQRHLRETSLLNKRGYGHRFCRRPEQAAQNRKQYCVPTGFGPVQHGKSYG